MRIINSALANVHLERNPTIPVLEVEGTNYEVGLKMGTTFKKEILEFLGESEWVYELDKQSRTPAGQKVYNETLENMSERFPWLVEEIQGISDGSGIPFETHFLLQLDDIMTTINEENPFEAMPVGCTDLGLNRPGGKIIMGHTEDALAEMVNRLYVVKAHVKPSQEMKAKGAKEESFAALTYPGHLPGYTMGFNAHGLLHSINTLSPQVLKPGRTPRTFLARSLLGASSVDEFLKILKDDGLGAANGFNVNLYSMIQDDYETILQIETAPNLKEGAKNSLVKVHETREHERIWHVNKYKFLNVQEIKGEIIESSESRQKALLTYPQPKRYSDVTKVLSDQSGNDFQIFAEYGPFQTICVGIFDIHTKLWNIYTRKPNINEPAASISLNLNGK